MQGVVCCYNIVNDLLSNVFILVLTQVIEDSRFFRQRNFEKSSNVMVLKDAFIIIHSGKDRFVFHFKEVIMTWMIDVMSRTRNQQTEEGFIIDVEDLFPIAFIKKVKDVLGNVCSMN